MVMGFAIVEESEPGLTETPADPEEIKETL
jgi:hypothetical protein